MPPKLRNSVAFTALLLATLAPKFVGNAPSQDDERRWLVDASRAARDAAFSSRTVPAGNQAFAIEAARGDCIVRAMPLTKGGFQYALAQRELALPNGMRWIAHGRSKYEEPPRLRPAVDFYAARGLAMAGFDPGYRAIVSIAATRGCAALPDFGGVPLHLTH